MTGEEISIRVSQLLRIVTTKVAGFSYHDPVRHFSPAGRKPPSDSGIG